MRKVLIPLLVLLIGVLIVAGCSSGATTTTSTAKPTATTPGATTTGAVTTTAVKPTTGTATATKPPTPTATASKYGGIMIDIEASGPGTPFGWPPDLAGGAGISGQIGLDQLLHEDRTGKIFPNLATSYDVVSDPKNASITFHLRKGVKFHDGTDFNAQAVKWNLDMIKTGINPSVTALWKSWEVLDDYTVRVNLTTWQNTIVRNFTGISTTFASPTAARPPKWSTPLSSTN